MISDHLPVLNKSALYLTIPLIDDIEKLIHQKLTGVFQFSSISIQYDFTECFSELELELILPVKLKLAIHYFLNETPVESKSVILKVNFWINLFII